MRKFSGVILLTALFLCIVVFSPAARCEAGDDPVGLRQEFEELKRENSALKKRVEKIETEEEEKGYSLGILPGMIRLSGYADAEYIHTDEESENDGFRLHHFSLFFAADIQPKWRFFSEIEYEDAPFIEAQKSSDTADVIQGKLFVEQVYIQYHPGLTWDFKVGRFLTPIGIWNIFHYPPYVLTQRRPLMLRTLFPETSDGVNIRYSYEVLGSLLDTQFYLANGTGNPGRLDRNGNKAVGLRLNYPVDILNGLDIGASYFRDKDNSDVTRSDYGVHLLLNFKNFEFQSEFVERTNNPSMSPAFNDIGFYAQLSYDIKKWTIGARYDRLDEDDTVPDNEHNRYTAAFNYHFAYNVVVKSEYNWNEFADPSKTNFGEVILSVAVALGEL